MTKDELIDTLTDGKGLNRETAVAILWLEPLHASVKWAGESEHGPQWVWFATLGDEAAAAGQTTTLTWSSGSTTVRVDSVGSKVEKVLGKMAWTVKTYVLTEMVN